MTTIALPTGRSLGDCVEILKGAGLPTENLSNAGRHLVVADGPFRYLLGKPTDIPTLVSQGAADLALVGNDVTDESEVDVTEILDTGRGKCFMAVAGTPETAVRFDGHVTNLMGLRVATKYVRTASRTFEEWGAQIRVLNLNGSVELAPALGLANCIFDIVQTGGTLKANGLVVIRRTAEVSLRLIANRSALQLRWSVLRETVDAIQKFVADATN
ncbi:ATP phosphoribosyltransferase [Synergistaceae bacterium OttesenSCG-928-I11]|nr:ATP phosphoribosyltransferase [Synergistaceae bacterium OttesenSCG-928-I11]